MKSHEDSYLASDNLSYSDSFNNLALALDAARVKKSITASKIKFAIY